MIASTIKRGLKGELTWREVARRTGLSQSQVLNLASLIQHRSN